MKYFVTGASGFIGMAVVDELLKAGHEVIGLARSEESAERLKNAGADSIKGSLEDLEALRQGAQLCDAVIHLAFVHDFSSQEAFFKAGTIDVAAIEAMGEALKGTDKPLVITSGIAGIKDGEVAAETDTQPATVLEQSPRRSELAAARLRQENVNISVVRLPPVVYGAGRAGFASMLIGLARQKGESSYIAEGLNRWSAVHYQDAARLFRLAAEKNRPYTYHGVGEASISLRSIAEVIGQRLDSPVVSQSLATAPAYFGAVTPMAMLDCPASSDWTKEELGWQPVHTDFLTEFSEDIYFE